MMTRDQEALMARLIKDENDQYVTQLYMRKITDMLAHGLDVTRTGFTLIRFPSFGRPHGGNKYRNRRRVLHRMCY